MGFNCFLNKLIPRMPSVCHIDLSPWNTLLYWKFPLCRKQHTWKLVIESYSHPTVPNSFARTIVRNSKATSFSHKKSTQFTRLLTPQMLVILLATNLITSLNNCDWQKTPSSKGPSNSTDRQCLKGTNIAICLPVGLKRQ